MISYIYNFFNSPFFAVIGGITVLISLFLFFLNIVFWLLGIAPLLFRLGFGRWFRKVAIVAEDSFFKEIENDLKKSGIFRKIIPIYPGTLSEIKDYDLFVVHYDSFNDIQIKEILSYKKANAGMIFYYPEFDPQTGKQIPKDISKLIGNKENTTIVNFRGRLLNDIITTLITTSYEKR